MRVAPRAARGRGARARGEGRGAESRARAPGRVASGRIARLEVSFGSRSPFRVAFRRFVSCSAAFFRAHPSRRRASRRRGSGRAPRTRQPRASPPWRKADRTPTGARDRRWMRGRERVSWKGNLDGGGETDGSASGREAARGRGGSGKGPQMGRVGRWVCVRRACFASRGMDGGVAISASRGVDGGVAVSALRGMDGSVAVSASRGATRRARASE